MEKIFRRQELSSFDGNHECSQIHQSKNLVEVLDPLTTNGPKKAEQNKEKKDTLERFERVKDEIGQLRASTDQISKHLDEYIKETQIQFDFKLKENAIKSTQELKEATNSVS